MKCCGNSGVRALPPNKGIKENGSVVTGDFAMLIKASSLLVSDRGSLHEDVLHHVIRNTISIFGSMEREHRRRSVMRCWKTSVQVEFAQTLCIVKWCILVCVSPHSATNVK